jgi:hypothetical protein
MREAQLAEAKPGQEEIGAYGDAMDAAGWKGSRSSILMVRYRSRMMLI